MTSLHRVTLLKHCNDTIAAACRLKAPVHQAKKFKLYIVGEGVLAGVQQ